MIELNLNKELQGYRDNFQLAIEVSIERGKLISVYGESGAGKTSLLRLISGLLHPDEGIIKINDTYWFDSKRKINLKTQKRNIGYVFQDYALFPHMSIKENIAFALPKEEKKSWLKELIQMIDLENLQDRLPDTLSGGQKQRVALARALARKPEILLLDEPLSALDHSMRSELQDHILQLHNKMELTTIMVSHDIGEITKMSDSVIQMEKGKIIKIGDALSIFSKREISGKFQFTGEILEIQPSDVIFIVTVLIGKNIVKVVMEEKAAEDLSIGDKVMVVSKAFNPIIYKIGA